MDERLRDHVQAWLVADPDPDDHAELTAVLAAADTGDPTAAVDLAARFESPLRFGTAGLRGPLRAGPGGMNTAVVRRAAAGLGRYLLSQAVDTIVSHRVVVIGYDARHRSADFARDSAAVLAALGFDVRLLPEALPTPVLAYAVRRLGAVAGVMVTASHNPPRDNGYKVYGPEGAQIVGPTDVGIEQEISQAGAAAQLALSSHYTRLDDSIVGDYLDAVTGLVTPGGPRQLRVVHTALHGVAWHTVRSAFVRAGFAPPIPVTEQAVPDPDFPTVVFPNPEEPGAMDLALALAAERDADLVIANDPDSDRCAVGVPTAEGWRLLTGDELGVLLADWLMQHGRQGSYATTIVSSQLLEVLAAARGFSYAETLTGFKWIARAADDLAYGYEEALGYAVAPAIVRDKDGVSAALLVAEMAAAYRAAGSCLTGRLEELYAEFGQYRSRQLSWRVTDITTIAIAMAALRSDRPAVLLGTPAEYRDLAPDADVVILRTDTARVVIRPSGTEPKLKCYLEVRGTAGVETGGNQDDRLDRLAREVRAFIAIQ